jgi:hypothetical protein
MFNYWDGDVNADSVQPSGIEVRLVVPLSAPRHAASIAATYFHVRFRDQPAVLLIAGVGRH